MESLSNYELMELIRSMSGFVDSQFEYWLTISFAAIIAGAVAGDRLGRRVRSFLIILYLMTTALILLQVFQTGQSVGQIVEELTARGLVTGDTTNTGPLQFWIRVVIFFLGTVGTCWFLWADRKILSLGP